MTERLAGKIAVLTAAGSGIGRACAERFALEGAIVVASDIDGERAAETAKRIEEAGGIAHAERCDVTDSAQVDALIQQAAGRLGRLDVLMNVAGLAIPSPIVEMTNELWRQVHAIALDGTFFGTRAALAIMLSQGSGSIINIASGAALGGEPGLAAYGAAKAGILNLTQTAAIESARQGVRVNAICPGVIATPPMLAWADNSPAGREGFARSLPIPRMGTPEEVANVALFLASDEAAYVTGANYIVDAGVSARIASPGKTER